MDSFYNSEIKNELVIKYNVFFDEWYGIVEDILLHPEFQKRKLFLHHHNKSVFDHCVEVSYNSFMAAKYFNADVRVCAVAGLLHDFYPKAWLYTSSLAEYDTSYLSELTKVKPLFKRHGFTHANEALENTIKYFPQYIDDKVSDAIRKHMFPLNIRLPRYRESWIITIIDKRNSMGELPSIGEMIKFPFRKLLFFKHEKHRNW